MNGKNLMSQVLHMQIALPCSKKLGLDTYKNTNGFFTEYSMTIPSEDMAEVYSHLITRNYKISDDKILNKKIQFIRDKLKEIDSTFVF
jgi:hypothetical protein